MSDLLRLMTRTHKALRAAVDEAMSQHGVRIGQNLVLEVLWATDGLTPGELAGRLSVAAPTVVNTATRMEAAGLIERRRDTVDRRLVRLFLTEAGRAAQQPVEAAQRRLERRATATLTAEERQHLENALTKILAQLTDPAD